MGKTRLDYLIACNTMIKEFGSLRPSLIGIFDFISIPTGQSEILYSFSVGGKIENSENKVLKIDIQIIGPDRSLFAEFSTNPPPTPLLGDINIEAKFPFSKFTTPGRYLLKAVVDGKELEDGDRFYFKVIQR